MRLKKEEPIQRVRIVVSQLFGTRVEKTQSLNVYEAKLSEVFAIVEKAILKACVPGS